MHIADALSFLPELEASGSVEAETETINTIQYRPISEERLQTVQFGTGHNSEMVKRQNTINR